MNHEKSKCPYCLSEDIRTVSEGWSRGDVPLVYFGCRDCLAYTFDIFEPNEWATEVEMATGWHPNLVDCPLWSPFSTLGKDEALKTFKDYRGWLR